MTHACADCGLTHDAPLVVEAEPEAAVEATLATDVEIARIEADRDIKVARIGAGVAETEIESRIGALEGELRGMREALDRLAPAPEPEPAPAPIVVDAPVTEPEVEMPPKELKAPRAAPQRRGFFG